MKTQFKTSFSWLLYFSITIFCALIQYPAATSLKYSYPIFWFAGVMLVFFAYRSIAPVFEMSILLLVWLILHPAIYTQVLLLNLAIIVLFFVEYRVQSTVSLALATAISGAMFAMVSFADLNGFHWIILSFTVLLETLYIISRIRDHNGTVIKSIDALICSYTGNTAHFANEFIEKALALGANVKVHRFHYHNEFKADLNGDSLVIAFPVIGWKPPWPFISYLIRKLPNGHGKPAFIIYTAAGGPENAGIVAWFILRLKGYKVLGRCWGVYPMNVPTVRIGPQWLWNCIDKLFVFKSDIRYCRQSAVDFSKGLHCGLPLILWPFPLFIAGLVVENRFVNRIYRFYVWKKRCLRCGRCIHYCPAGRIVTGKNGYPEIKKGDCALCLGCINICPVNAMHGLFFTEYGRQYRSRWPEFVVVGKNLKS